VRPREECIYRTPSSPSVEHADTSTPCTTTKTVWLAKPQATTTSLRWRALETIVGKVKYAFCSWRHRYTGVEEVASHSSLSGHKCRIVDNQKASVDAIAAYVTDRRPYLDWNANFPRPTKSHQLRLALVENCNTWPRSESVRKLVQCAFTMNW